MTIKIYAWPKALRYTAWLTDEELPARASRGMFSGRDYVSSAGPRRRTVQVTAAALYRDRLDPTVLHSDGAGICASLNRLLGGRMNLVRMELPPVNWFREGQALRSEPMTWENSGTEFTWEEGGSPFTWFSGPLHTVTVTTSGPFPALAFSGLTPGQLVCRAYDVVQTYDDATLNGTSRAVRTVHADASGDAVIPLHDALAAGILSIGGAETAVFRVTSRGPSAQTIGADFPTNWTLREVLAGEYPNDAEEVDPWG